MFDDDIRSDWSAMDRKSATTYSFLFAPWHFVAVAGCALTVNQQL